MPNQLKESIRQTKQVGGIDTLESIPAGLLKKLKIRALNFRQEGRGWRGGERKGGRDLKGSSSGVLDPGPEGLEGTKADLSQIVEFYTPPPPPQPYLAARPSMLSLNPLSWNKNT
jgi:hypothetical protein